MNGKADCRKEFNRTVIFSWVMISTLLLYAIIVEITRITYKPFEGFLPVHAREWKDLYYGIAIISLLAAGSLRSSILKNVDPCSLESQIRRLHLSNFVTFSISEIPALVGLVLFCFGGLYKEFYLLLSYSLLGMAVYFPRYNVWKSVSCNFQTHS